MKKTILFILAGLAATLFPAPLAAHEFSASYSRLQVEGPVLRVQFTLNVVDLHQLQPPPDTNADGELSDQELTASQENITKAIQGNVRFEGPEAPSSTEIEGYERDGPSVLRFNLLYKFGHDLSNLRVTSTMANITQADHYHMLQIAADENTYQYVLDLNHPSIDLDLDGPTLGESFRSFVVLGMEHIVTGYDHLAFLVGLLVTTSTLLALIKVVTSFTLAHSITLALATLGIVTLPPRLIESLIALSIAYIAIENFMGRTLVHRWKITFLFGLVHGFGFSNILREMELTRRLMAVSLFSFNIGVEIGQLLFVCIVFPLIYYVGASRWKEQFLAATSLAIMALGFYWFVQRAFFG